MMERTSDLGLDVGTASVRDLIAHLALTEDQLRALRTPDADRPAPDVRAADINAPGIDRARRQVLEAQAGLVRELRRRRGRSPRV